MKHRFGALAKAPEGDDSERRIIEGEAALEASMEASASAGGKPSRKKAAPTVGGAQADVADQAGAAPSTGLAAPEVRVDTAADPTVVDGDLSTAPTDGEKEEPEIDPETEDQVAQWAAEGGGAARAGRPMDLKMLAQVAAGTRKKDDLVNAASVKRPGVSIIKPAPDAPLATSEDYDELFRGLSGGADRAAPPIAQTSGTAQAAMPAPGAGSEQPVPAGVATGPVAVPAVAQTIGDVAGQAIAGALAVPFLALTSAHRHLKQRFSTEPASSAGPSAGLSAAQSAARGAPLAALTTLEKITNWKCEQIEKSAANVLEAARDVRNVDGFVVWEDAVTREAGKRGVSAAEVVSAMRTDADLAPIREQMTALWHERPDTIGNFRREADVFEKHLRDVREKFANSDEGVRSRVTTAMREVQNGTSDLPGYGKEEGEYGPTLAERIREMVRVFMDLVEALVSRLTGRAASQTSPEIPG